MKKILVVIAIVLTAAIIIHRNNLQPNKIAKAVPVLMYHHFEVDKNDSNDMIVKKSEFEKQMKYLKNNGYTSISIKELKDFVEGKSMLPKNPILITADDGYLSNYDIMYPILKKLNMKATIFIIGNDIDNVGKTNSKLPKLTWDKIEEMYDSGIIDIECHTYNSHVKGNTISGNMGIFSSPLVGETRGEYEKRINNDIEKNINAIKLNLGYEPIAFSYPYGDWSETSEKILKNNGIKFTFVASGGKEGDIQKCYLLKRLGINGNYSMKDFKQGLAK